MKDFHIWVIAVLIFGAVGSTARYIHELGKKNEDFSFKKWITTTFIGATIAVIAGLVCKHLHLSQEITYAIVAVSAISSKELLESIPSIVMRFAKSKLGK